MSLRVTALVDGAPVACRTRDVSESGVFLEMAEPLDAGTSVELNLLDEDSGEALQIVGEVVRCILPESTGAVGVAFRLVDPSPEWRGLIQRLQLHHADAAGRRVARRLRVLVVGDEERQRGALALYVRSGWDVRFASDLEGSREALRTQRIDAVIAEHDLDDERWAEVLEVARDAQASARRIVRARLHGRTAPPPGGVDDLYHRVVDADAGLEAVLDALTADWGRPAV